jgi:hypothetical protein
MARDRGSTDGACVPSSTQCRAPETSRAIRCALLGGGDASGHSSPWTTTPSLPRALTRYARRRHRRRRPSSASTPTKHNDASRVMTTTASRAPVCNRYDGHRHLTATPASTRVRDLPVPRTRGSHWRPCAWWRERRGRAG